MPQARLPDINTAYITYRREVLSSLKSRNYGSCFGALYAINGLLPKDYRVTISNEVYNSLTDNKLYVTCLKCEEESEFLKVRVFDMILNSTDSILLNKQSVKVWVCPKCKEENRLDKTEMVKNQLKEPYFLKVVPKPPARREGMMDRTTYHNKIERWVWLFLDELEERMAQFRDDNWTKPELYDEEDDQITGEDEQA